MPFGPTTLLQQNDLMSKDKINSYILQPLADIINPPAAYYLKSSSDPNLTTASAVFVDMDATVGKFNLSITTKGNPVMIGFRGVLFNSGINTNYLDLLINGASYIGTTDGIMRITTPVATHSGDASFVEIITLGAGTYAFKLQWRTSGGTLSLPSIVPASFWVREL